MIVDTMKFINVEEIKFTKVRDNIYSISIKSDIESKSVITKDTIFESSLCRIDSNIELENRIDYYDISANGHRVEKETYSIPFKINLLSKRETEEIFTIKTNSQ